MNTILVLGAGKYQCSAIRHLMTAGFRVCSMDANPEAEGLKISDDFVVADISDAQEVLNVCKRKPISAIIPMNDFATRPAAYATQKLNLTGNTLLSATAANDKGLMRENWAVWKLLQPKYMIFDPSIKKSKIVENFEFPLIVKPTDCGGGGRGISIANAEEELSFSIEHAKKYAMNGRMIVEQFIEGTELTVEVLVLNGHVNILTMSDKVKVDSKFRVATSLNYPARITPEIKKSVSNTVCRAVEVMGVLNSAAHLEVIVCSNTGKVYLVEIGLRGGGGHVFSDIINLVTGINAPVALAEILSGETPDLKPKVEKGCVYRFFAPRNYGTIKNIRIDPLIYRNEALVSLEITAKIGDKYTGLTDSMHRIGYMIVKGQDVNDAIKNADYLEQFVQFDIA